MRPPHDDVQTAVCGIVEVHNASTGLDHRPAVALLAEEQIENSKHTSAEITRSPRRHRRRREPRMISELDRRAILQERRSRVRLLAWSALGVGCLLVAHWNHPEVGPLFALPSSFLGWLWLLCGVTGVWLAPGLWLSAVVARTGTGLSAWMGTRIATTLAWYAVVGPIIHQHGQGARVTTGGILIATAAATAAVSLGVLLGFSRWPAPRWQRLLVPAVIGAICAHTTIAVSMHLWTYGINYSHIRRLDWLIVLGCALLVVLGAASCPKLPPKRTVRTSRIIVFCLAVFGATVAALVVANVNWSPAQRMPSAIGIEQAPAPLGADVAFSLTAIGPEGFDMIRRARFDASDQSGRPLAVQTRLVGGAAPGDPEMLLVVLQPGSQPEVCRPGWPAKLTMRDQISGVRVQAVIPDGWCAP